MIDKYRIHIENEDVVPIKDNEIGNWVKYEDIEWLFKSQLDKLEFKDGDIMVLSIDKYHEQYQKQIYDTMKDFLKNLGFQNSGLLILTQPMDVGVVSTVKSN